MDNIFIDSDVLLDLMLLREPFLSNSVAILKLCELKEINGFITPVILANTYYVMRRQFNDEHVRKSLKELLQIISIIQIYKSEIVEALDSNFKDFEDALQNYSAEASGKINIILTRNTRDYKHSKLVVMTPEGFMGSGNL
jgi:predicted nucleic acid-binding protein